MAVVTSIVSAIVTGVVSAIAGTVVSFISQAIRGTPKTDTDALDFEQTVNRRLSNAEPLELLAGRRIVAGVGSFDDAYNERNENGVSVTIMSAVPCTAFHRLFLDGEPVELSGDPTVNEVAVTSHFTGLGGASRVRLRVFLGDDNSQLGSYLAGKFPERYSASDQHGEYCVVVLDCRNTNDDFDEEGNENLIPFQGYPEYKVELSGVRVCDPSIPGASYEDESTWVYSDNPSLIDAQYDYGWRSGVGEGRTLIIGNGYPVEIMNIDRIISNKTYCEINNLTCAGVIRSGSNSDQEEIQKTYNAERVETSATVYSVPEGNRPRGSDLDMSLHPAAYIAEYNKDGFSTEVYNEVQTRYSEPEEFYAEKDLPIYSRPEWVAQDNHIPRQLSLPLLFVTNMSQAAMLEKQEIVISRTPATVTINDLPFFMIREQVGSIITLINSDVEDANGKDWIIKGISQSPRGDVAFTLRQYAGDDALSFDPDTETPNVTVNPPAPRPWEEWGAGRQYVPPFIFQGINGAIGTIGGDIERIDESVGVIGGDVERIVNGELVVDDIKINGVGSVSSSLTMQGDDITEVRNLISPDGMQISRSPTQAVGTVDGGTDPITTNPITITVSGGVGPYTFAWSHLSGDVMTIDSPSSDVTTFTGTPSGPEFATLTAIYRCTVTDSSDPVLSIAINVAVDVTRFDAIDGGSGGFSGGDGSGGISN